MCYNELYGVLAGNDRSTGRFKPSLRSAPLPQIGARVAAATRDKVKSLVTHLPV